MPISFPCPVCAKRIRVSRRHAGKRGKCPRCQGTVQVPDVPGTASEPQEELAELPETSHPAGLRPADQAVVDHAIERGYLTPQQVEVASELLLGRGDSLDPGAFLELLSQQVDPAHAAELRALHRTATGAAPPVIPQPVNPFASQPDDDPLPTVPAAAPPAPLVNKRGTSSRRSGKKPRAPKPRSERRRSDDGEEEPVAASAGPDRTVVVALAAVGLGLLLLLAGLTVVFGDNPPPPPPLDDDEAAATERPPPSPEEAPPEPGPADDDALPTLPRSDLRAASTLVADWIERHPDDREGALTLYGRLLLLVPPEREAARERITSRMDALREEAAKEAGEAFDEWAKKANAELEDEDYAGALAAWLAAREALSGDEVRQAIDDELARVRAAQAQAEALADVLRQTSPEPSSDEEAELAAMRRLAAALAEAPDVAETKPYARALERVRAGRQVLRAEDRRRAKAYLEDVRVALAKREQERRSAWTARAQQARKRTRARPIRYKGKSRIVEALSEREFRLSGEGGDAPITLRYGQVPRVTAKVLYAACRPDVPTDLAEVVSFSLKHQLFKTAERALGKLAKLDPEGAARLPDVDRLRRRSRPWLGDPIEDEDGVLLGSVYDFRGETAPKFMEDWEAIGDDVSVEAQPGKGLRIAGKGSMAVLLEEVGLDGGVRVEVDLPQSAERDGIVVLRLDVVGSKGHRVAAYVSRKDGSMMLLASKVDGGELEEASKWIRGDGRGLRLTLLGGEAVLESGRDRVATQVPAFSRLVIELTTAGKTEPASITWPRVKVLGKARPEWLRKQLAAYQVILQKELLRDPVVPTNLPAPPAKAGDLPSCDDAAALAGFSAAELDSYRAAWRALADAVAAPAAEKVLRKGEHAAAAEEAFAARIRARGRHAGAYYGRALARLEGEDYSGARGDLDLALGLDPGFAEALVVRGEIRYLYGDLAAARKDLDRAVELAPDLAMAYRRRGLLGLAEEDHPSAAEAFFLAMVLDPTDLDSRGFYLKLRQVLEGPPWETTHTHATDHFEVRTNISPERAQEVGALLERGRAVYAEVIGPPPADAPKKKASCLVFDTDVGFLTYAAAVRGRHDARTLGLYSGLFKQLLFFEDKNDASGDELKEVLYHEGFHRYADEVIPGVPTWANEGLAEMLAGELVTRTGILEGRLSNLETALADKQVPKVAALMRMSQDRFYAEDSHVNYAAAWALCRYLVRGKAGAAGPAFKRYIALLRERGDPDEAFAKAFEGVDLEALDASWRRYVAAMR